MKKYYFEIEFIPILELCLIVTQEINNEKEYLSCFVQSGTICTIQTHEKHPWRSVVFSKVAG